MLEVKDLVIRYGPFLACDRISIEVKAGEIVGVIGPNGAGKSSVVRAIAGLVKPASGSVSFLGQSTLDRPVHELIRQGLSLVPEGRGLFPQMSVEENLLMGGYSLTSKTRRKQLMDNCYELFPILKERRNQYAGTLSGGQQQMVAVSVGLMGDPKFCIFDEPSLGLAPIVIQQIGETLQKMRALNLTVLLIEHDVKLVMGLCDRVAVLDEGQVIAEGTPAHVQRDARVMQAYLGTAQA
jgi:branched-chain amino acid transport system ATP-binding protein